MAEHDEDQDQPQHAEFSRDVENQGDKPEPEHAGFEDTRPDDDADADGELSIIEEWDGDYPSGTALFCAKFTADDFDSDWGEAKFPEGATVAIRRGSGRPSQGFILRHAQLSEGELTKVILERHASADALTILYSLKDTVFDAFVEAWGKDGGMTPGKSNRSARRSGSTRRR